MRLIYTFLGCLIATGLFAEMHEDHPYHFTIHPDNYKTATLFQIHSEDTYIGTNKKSSFRLRTNYDLSNKDGWQATGIVRILSLGSVFPWAKEIDVYDTQGTKIGMIDGQMVTTEEAKYSIYQYDEQGDYIRIGIAYLNEERDAFSILESDGGPHPIAQLRRVFVVGAADYWEVDVYYPEKIDDRIIRILSAFALDHQSSFLSDDIDPEEPIEAE